MLIRSEVVNPKCFRPRSRAGRLAIEEQDVRLNSLRVEDSSGQAKQRLNVGLLQQFPPNGLSGAAFKQHIVVHNDGRAPINLQARFHVLQELELLVARGCPEVITDVSQRLFALIAFFIDHGNALLLPERRIRQHHFVGHSRLFRQAVYAAIDRAVVAADAVQVEVHHAQPSYTVHQFVTRERLSASGASSGRGRARGGD